MIRLDTTTVRPRAALIVTLALALLATLACLERARTWRQMQDGDLARYASYSAQLLRGQVPFRDFAMEYPPAALLPMLAPRLLVGVDASESAYGVAFAITSIAWIVLAIALVGGRIVWPALATILLAPLVLYRFDAFPALMAAGAVAATVRGRPTLAGALLAVGALAKLSPAVLAPLIVAYLWRDRRAVRRFVLGGAIAGVAVLAPLAILAPGWPKIFLAYHLGRGLQIESLPASVYLLASQLGLVRATVDYGAGSFNLAAPGANAVASAMLPLMLVAMLAVYAIACRRVARRVLPLGEASFVALLAFVLFNKVLSPQYLVWLVPFVGLVRPRLAIAFALACALSTLIFPTFYRELIRGELLPTALLVARNALLAATFAAGVIDLRRRGSPTLAACPSINATSAEPASASRRSRSAA